MAFTCPRCGITSAHPEDERQEYCGACHEFVGSPKACAVCGRSLMHRAATDEYFHGPQDDVGDHPPVPVPYDELGEQFRGRCDFCNQELPEFVLPVRDFVLENAPDYGNRGGWAACRPCAEMIDRNDWNGVKRRHQAYWEKAHGPVTPEIERIATAMWRQVRKNTIGGLRPIAGSAPRED